MKRTPYFSHDCNARNDEKIIAMRMKEGNEGYGIFWQLIEKLAESSDYKLRKDYEVIAFELRTECERIRNVVEEYTLFKTDKMHFWSESLLSRMKLKDEKRRKASESAKKRWDSSRKKCETNANALQTQSERYANKIKENKIKESNKKSKPKKVTRFTPPTQQEIKKYLIENKNLAPNIATIEAEKFWHFYESKHWYVGKNKMKVWKSSAALWVSKLNELRQGNLFKKPVAPHQQNISGRIKERGVGVMPTAEEIAETKRTGTPF